MKRIAAVASTNATGPANRSSLRLRRKGTAQVELALFLPLYAAILMVLPTLSSFIRTHQNVVVNARHQAWLKQSDYGDATQRLDRSPTGAEKIGRILLGQQDTSAGVVSGKNEGKAKIYLKAFDVAVDAQSEHYLFTDPWDHRVLEFEDENNHPALTMGERVRFAGDVHRSAFSGLASTAGASAQDASTHLTRIANRQQQAQEQASKAAAEVKRLMDRVEDQIDSIQKQLDVERNKIPVDANRINSLSRQLRNVEQELQKLKGDLEKIEQMKSMISIGL